MKRMKKIVSLLLTLVMVAVMAVPAFALSSGDPEPQQKGTLTIHSVKNGETYDLYKIFDLKYGTTTDAAGKNKELYAYTVNANFKEFFEGIDYEVEGVTYNVKNTDLTDADKADKLPSNASLDMKAVQYMDRDVVKANIADLATVLKGYIDAKEVSVTKSVAAENLGEGVTDLVVTDIDFGYYIMVPRSTNPSAEGGISALFSLDTVTPTAEITKKGSYPTITKKINTTPDGTDETLKDANTASIGEVVHYVEESAIPDTSGYKVYYFIVKDTLSAGLTFNNDVAININWKDASGSDQTKLLTAGTDYEVIMYGADGSSVSAESYGNNKESVRSFEIVFKDVINRRKEDIGRDVKITYSATVNDNAKVGTSGNDNKVKLEYSNKPEQEHNGNGNPDKPGPDEVTGETPEDITLTYIAGIQINKIDPTNNKGLAGAKFKIKGNGVKKLVVVKEEKFEKDTDGSYYALIDNTYTTTAPTEETKNQYKGDGPEYTKYKRTVVTTTQEVAGEAKEIEAVVDDNGFLIFEGLGAGNYEIEEIEAPTGYNKLSNPIRITIGAVISDNENSDITDLEVNDGTETCKWTGTYDLQDDTGEHDFEFKSNTVTSSEGVNTVHGVLSFMVENRTGVELPSTGGMGTTIFYVLGSILLIGAGILLVTKKKMAGRQ